jgi:hypothetical protein
MMMRLRMRIAMEGRLGAMLYMYDQDSRLARATGLYAHRGSQYEIRREPKYQDITRFGRFEMMRRTGTRFE